MYIEPAFWNDQLYRVPWCIELKQKAPTIRLEVLDLIYKSNPFIPYPKYPIQGFKSLYENTWEAFPLSIFESEYVEDNKDALPFDLDLIVKTLRSNLPVVNEVVTDLEQQGVLRNIFVSRLIPGSVINPHHGWCDKFLRIHQCLKADSNCKITVGNETRTWIQDELLAFKDGGPYLHSIKHEGSSERIIISYDLNLNYVSKFIPEIIK